MLLHFYAQSKVRIRYWWNLALPKEQIVPPKEQQELWLQPAEDFYHFFLLDCFLLVTTVPSKDAVTRNLMIRVVDGNSGTLDVVPSRFESINGIATGFIKG